MKRFILMLIVLSVAASALDLPPGVIKLQEYQNELAYSITFLMAFIGGLLTFTSPCGFVVLPTFFSYVFKERKRALAMTGLFCLGMTLAFVLFGIIAGLVGDFFNIYKEFFAILSGILLVVFGLMMILNTGFSLFNFKVKHKPNGSVSTFFLGFFFAVGWTPCVGPILGGVLLLAANTANAAKAAALFGFYSLGIALPLLAASALSDRYDFSKWFTSRHVSFSIFGHKVHTHLYGIVGGILLILVGIIMFVFQGTRVFMTEIPKYIPWTMSFFTMVNERLVANAFFTSTKANIIGSAILIATLLIFWKLHKKYKQEASKHKP